MVDLEDLAAKCVICKHRGNHMACSAGRCVRCVLDKKPDPGCVGVPTCRRDMVKQLNTCTNYSPNPWDN